MVTFWPKKASVASQLDHFPPLPLAARQKKASLTEAHLLSQPGDLLDLPAAACRVAGPQHGVELSQDLWEEGHDVGVDCHEPRMRRGRVLAAKDQGVPAVR